MVGTKDLIERVTIQAETRTSNGQGGYVTAWADLAGNPTVWAAVRGLSGGEALTAGVQRSVQQWRVIIRRRADITTRHRLRWDNAGTYIVMDIKAAMPLPDQPRDFTLLVCESGLVD
jgi:SPP1 family predicted phage head-tail adaptor